MIEFVSLHLTVIRRAGVRLAACAALGLIVQAAVAQVAAPASAASAALPASPARSSTADYIVVVVNQELVTNAELQLRIATIRDEASRSKTQLPPAADLRRQVLDVLINERVLVTNARETGPRIDEAELDRAATNVALQNQMTMAQLRARLKQQGIEFSTFRNNIKDQMAVERVREREVNSRIRISNEEIDALLEKRRAEASKVPQLNIAQILISVPEGASDTEVASKRARAEAALARVKGGETFETVAREVSEDGNKAQGGVIGLRPADRIPDVFVEATRALKPGGVAAALLRSGAGFHVLKLVERTESNAFMIEQTRARHILLRTSPQLTQQAAERRLTDFKREILAGSKTFEQLARENSEDGSASRGGDLGWASPGMFVPEFEDTMKALSINGISDPLVSRFGVHLIQVLERRETMLEPKQQREQARNQLRELKFDEAYSDWIRDLRARAYIELRDPPQQAL